MRENLQTPIAATYRDTIKIHSVFPTIQGEGPLCGERALFIRLYGCNLRCPGCDTEYTDSCIDVAQSYMLSKAESLGWPKGALVVITGGEPMRQNIAPSIGRLLRAGYRVQVETNGVLWPEGMQQLVYTFGTFDKLQIVCSPKTHKIHERIHSCATAFKYVLQAGDVNPDDGLPIRALAHKAAPHVARPRAGAVVYVQPMDEGDPVANAVNLDAAIRSCLDHGHRLQIQVHKIINME